MPKKQRINSSRKGKRGERLLLKPLEQWWGSSFHRTPGSGAWGTQHKKDELAQDIVCDDPSFPFDIEVKNCEGWSLLQLLTAPKSNLFAWWDQARSQCAPDKKPLLCFKKNRQPFLIMARVSDIPEEFETPYLVLHYNEEALLIATFNQLVACNPASFSA